MLVKRRRNTTMIGQNVKKSIAVSILAVVVALTGTGTAIPTFAEGLQENKMTGTCGDNVSWILDKKDGTLKLNGSGDTGDYEESPWEDYSGDVKSISVGDGITSVGAHLFDNLDNFTGLYISKDVKKIGVSAFEECDHITNLYLPDALTSIGDRAFYGCRNIQTLELPDKLTDIGEDAFNGCRGIWTITVPSTLESIGQDAFSGCSNIDTVLYSGSQDKWDSISGEADISATVKYGTDLSYIEPERIDDAYFQKPLDSDKENFYGGDIVEDEGLGYVDVEDATFGPENGRICVSLPRNSYIKYGFSNLVEINDDSVLYLRSISDYDYEHADVYLITESGEMIYVGDACEDTEFITFSLKDINQRIQAIEVIGVDYGGGWPGFDINGVAVTGVKTDIPSGIITHTTVSMNRNDKMYDIVYGSQYFQKDSSEEADIIVNPYWGSKERGTVSIEQNNKTIQSNASGKFIKIRPGELFDRTGDIQIVLRDNNYNKIETQKVNIIIGDAAQEDLGITVHKNKNLSTDKKDKYEAGTGVSVRMGTETLTPDKEGKVTIPGDYTGKVEFSCKGYVTRSFDRSQLEKNPDIYLQKVNDKGPVISGVWIDDVDVLNTSYPVNELSKEERDIALEIDWGGSDESKAELTQDGRSVAFDGGYLTTVLGDHFDTSGTIKVEATDKAGNKTIRALKIGHGIATDGDEKKTGTDLDGFKLDFGDSLEFTLPDSVKPKILAGMKVGVDLTTVTKWVPVTVSVDSGKVYVAIGVDIVNNAPDEKKGKNETQTFISGIKKLKQDGKKDGKSANNVDKGLWNAFQKKWDKELAEQQKGKFGVEADFTVVGFAEGTLDDNGNLALIDSGLILNPSVSLSKTFPFSIGPVPMYFETALAADITARFNLYVDQRAKAFTPLGDIAGDISVSGSLGAGIKKVAYVSGGITGTFSPDLKINKDKSNYFILKASLNGNAKAGIAFFEGSWEFPDEGDRPEVTLVEYKDGKTIWLPDRKTSRLLASADMYNEKAYKPVNLGYLDQGSVFTANAGILNHRLLDSLDVIGSKEKKETLKTNIYKQSVPQIVELTDGKKMAVWIDGDSSDANKICLYYSVYDGFTWSQPKLVSDDGTLDMTPVLRRIAGKVYLTWQNATRTFDDISSLSLSDIAEDFDIAAATYDEETDSFNVSQIKNDHLDMIPVVCGNSYSKYVVWVNNADNNWFGEGENNSIMYSEYYDGKWSDPEVLQDGLKAIGGIDATMYDGSLKVGYSMDTDGDLSTSDDTRVFENGKRISKDVLSYAPQYFNGRLYWYSDNNIVNSAFSKGTGNIPSSAYQLINVNGNTAAIYTAGDGLKSKLMMSCLDETNRRWGQGIEIASDNSSIGSFATYVSDDGSVDVIMNSAQVTGTISDSNPYGQSSLELLSFKPSFNLSVEDVYYNGSDYKSGNNLPITVTVKNNGTQSIKGAVVTIKDTDGNETTSDIPEVLAPGDTYECQLSYSVGTVKGKRDIEISAAVPYQTDSDPSDNTKTVTLSNTDVILNGVTYRYNKKGQIVVTTEIANNGSTATGKMQAVLTKGNSDGKKLKTIKVKSIAAGKSRKVSFTVTGYRNDIYTVVVSGGSPDIYASDFTKINEGADATTLKSVKGGSKKLTVKWKKQKTATGYQIQYATSKSFKKARTVTISKKNTVSQNIKKLKAGKKYYVRIRTYKTQKGIKMYSKWSGTKYAKTRK